MATNVAYATATEYRQRTGMTDTTEDAEIGAQLLAVSRLLDKRTGRFFGKDDTVQTRYFNGLGRTRLDLYADIASVAGLVVKVDNDGDYDYEDADETLVIDTDYWLGPENAQDGPEPGPYRYVLVNPTTTRYSAWPAQQRGVRIDAIWGWPEVPGAIREATILLTRELRDLQEAGYTLTLQNIDAAVALAPGGPKLLKQIVEDYRTEDRKRVLFA